MKTNLIKELENAIKAIENGEPLALIQGFIFNNRNTIINDENGMTVKLNLDEFTLNSHDNLKKAYSCGRKKIFVENIKIAIELNDEREPTINKGDTMTKNQANGKKAMIRAWKIRKDAASKWNCKISEIAFGICLKMAWIEIKKEETKRENKSIAIKSIAKPTRSTTINLVRITGDVDKEYDRFFNHIEKFCNLETLDEIEEKDGSIILELDALPIVAIAYINNNNFLEII